MSEVDSIEAYGGGKLLYSNEFVPTFAALEFNQQIGMKSLWQVHMEFLLFVVNFFVNGFQPIMVFSDLSLESHCVVLSGCLKDDKFSFSDALPMLFHF